MVPKLPMLRLSFPLLLTGLVLAWPIAARAQSAACAPKSVLDAIVIDAVDGSVSGLSTAANKKTGSVRIVLINNDSKGDGRSGEPPRFRIT